MSELIKLPVKYNSDTQFIFDDDSNIFCDVRGYGKLASKFGDAKAEKLQDENGEFIAKAINNHERLEKENAELRDSISQLNQLFNHGQDAEMDAVFTKLYNRFQENK